jgi:hypothetical protein
MCKHVSLPRSFVSLRRSYWNYRCFSSWRRLSAAQILPRGGQWALLLQLQTLNTLTISMSPLPGIAASHHYVGRKGAHSLGVSPPELLTLPPFFLVGWPASSIRGSTLPPLFVVGGQNRFVFLPNSLPVRFPKHSTPSPCPAVVSRIHHPRLHPQSRNRRLRLCPLHRRAAWLRSQIKGDP